MNRRNPRRKVDLMFARIGDEICEDIKNGKIKRFDLSDLTARLVPILDEMKNRLKKQAEKDRITFGGKRI